MAGWLGIDMGGTASRWAWIGPSGEIRRGAVGGATGLIHDATRRANFSRVLSDIRAALGEAPEAVHLGITGAGRSHAGAPEGAPELNALAKEALGAGRVSNENDAELAHRAAFSGGAGVLVIAGTGSVAIGRGAGEMVLVGGRGALIDDRGSASWIALEALRAVYAKIDATGSAGALSPLLAALERHAGGAGWEVMVALLYGADRGKIGLLARGVAEAEAEGCARAGAIMAAAGAELARMAEQLRGQISASEDTLGEVYIGGALALSPRIREAVLKARPQATFPQLDAALAAARHAQERA